MAPKRLLFIDTTKSSTPLPLWTIIPIKPTSISCLSMPQPMATLPRLPGFLRKAPILLPTNRLLLKSLLYGYAECVQLLAPASNPKAKNAPASETPPQLSGSAKWPPCSKLFQGIFLAPQQARLHGCCNFCRCLWWPRRSQ